MGMERISHIETGFSGWQADEMPIESYELESQPLEVARELLNQLFELHQMPLNDRNPDPKLITGYWSHGPCAPAKHQWFGSICRRRAAYLI